MPSTKVLTAARLSLGEPTRYLPIIVHVYQPSCSLVIDVSRPRTVPCTTAVHHRASIRQANTARVTSRAVQGPGPQAGAPSRLYCNIIARPENPPASSGYSSIRFSTLWVSLRTTRPRAYNSIQRPKDGHPSFRYGDLELCRSVQVYLTGM